MTFYGKMYTNAYALNAQKLTANERIANTFWDRSNGLLNALNGWSKILNALFNAFNG